MTPHRTETVASAATGSLRHLLAVPIDTTGVVAASGVAALSWAFGSANVTLLALVLVAMVLDLITGSLRAVVDPLQDFSIAKLYGGFLGKLFRLVLIPTASLIDWLYIASPMPLPSGYETAFPVTAMATIALAAAEITSILDKLRDGGVAPGLVAVIMRRMDQLRTGGEPPARRHYDVQAIAEEQEREHREHS